MRTADAQSPPAAEYVAVDLGTLPGFAAATEYTAFAMNGSNVVVGFATGSYNGAFAQHAWIWAPCGEYGLPAATMVDLTVLAGYGGCATCFGEAYDINDAGIVVGAQVLEPNGETRAFVWDLSAGVASAVLLALENPGSLSASAQGISNASPPVVVGYRYYRPTPPPFVPPWVESFRWVYSSPSSITISPMHPSGAPDSRAYDVNSLAEPRAVGFVANESLPEECYEDSIGGRWTLTGSGFTFAALNESPYPVQPVHTSLHATNDTNQSCGLIQHQLGGNCRAAALFVNAGGAMTDLGDPSVVTGLPATPINTRAWGMSDAAGAPGFEVNVVGDDISNTRALFWRRDGGVWSVFQLDTRIPMTSAWIRLERAHDINAAGWICGAGRKPGTPNLPIRAFAAIPGPPCESDFDADGYVGASELALLLGAWGTCPKCEDCIADLSGDCSVGSADLAILLGQWGFCHPAACGSQLGSSASEQYSEMETSEQSQAGSDGIALAALGFSSVAEFAAWVADQPDASAWSAAVVFHALLEGGQP